MRWGVFSFHSRPPTAVADGPFDDENDCALFDAPCPMRAVRPGECIVFEPLVAHAPCHTDAPGTRLRKVPATYEDGAYRFTARVAAGEGANAPTMVYELAAE